MTISGDQESRVRPASWRSGDFNAGIPLKKRKYLFRPASPTPDATSTPKETGSICYGEGNSSQGAANSKASNTATAVSFVPEAWENTVPHEIGSSEATNFLVVERVVGHPNVEMEDPLVQTDSLVNAENENLAVARNSNVLGSEVGSEMVAPAERTEQIPVDLSKVKTEVPCVSLLSDSSVHPDIKEKLIEANCSTEIGLDKTEMKLIQTMDMAHDINKETSGEQKVEGGTALIFSADSGNTEFRSHGWGHLNLDMAGQNSGSSIQYQETSEPLSLNFSVSKGECSTHNMKNISHCNYVDADYSINRSNWDLNTTMDSWEEALDGYSADTGSQKVIPQSSIHEIVSARSVPEERGKEKVGFRYDIASTSTQSDHQYNSGCSLSLGLGTFCFLGKSSTSSSVDGGGAGHTDFPRPTLSHGNVYTDFSMPTVCHGNVKSVNLSSVKSESLEEIVRIENNSEKDISLSRSDTMVKIELVERCGQETGLSSIDFSKATGSTSSAHISKAAESATFFYREPTTSVHFKALDEKEGMSKQTNKQMVQINDNIHTCYISSQLDRREPHAANVKSLPISSTEIAKSSGTCLTENKSIDYHKGCNLKECGPISCGAEECSPSDEEKISLPGDIIEEDSCGTDYELDGGHNVTNAKKKQDGGGNEYEDGEVQEPVAFNSLGHHDRSSLSLFEEKIPETKNCINYLKDCENLLRDETNKGLAYEDACLIDSIEMPTTEVEKKSIQAIQRNPHDVSEEKDAQKSQSRKQSPYQNASQGISGVSTGSGEILQKPALVEENSSASDKADASTSGDFRPKDSNSGGSSRIINLTPVSSKSPVKIIEASGCLLPPRTERGRLPDFPLEADKCISRRREEDLLHSSYKFSRERQRDHFPRNSRLNFVDRRREFYGGRREFPVSRVKYEAGLMDADISPDNYGNTHEDGAFTRSFQRGKRLSNDGATFSSDSPPNRRSRGFPYMHSDPDSSSRRSSAENSSAFRGHRNGGKFMRDLPCNNNLDPVFSRPQHSYGEFDGRFVKGNRNFSSTQRRYHPQFRSGSPDRSRARSPGPCPSFNNASPGRFGGFSDLPRRRTSPNYRMDRTRSFDHSCFSRDRDIRRRGSPTCTSRPSNNAPRDIDSGRGGHFCRPHLPFRNNTSGRGMFRPRRRFDSFDPRERTYCDDFEGPMQSGRFDDFRTDVNFERTYVNRRESIRAFDPSLIADDCEPSNAEDDADAIRFCQENDAEILEQETSRGFDRLSNENSAESSRRVQIIEKEGTSTHAMVDCNNEDFDDVSRGK